jgi:KipI family sensor histidine kinase inhibitor
VIVRSYGSDALLVELASTAEAVALRARLDAEPPAGTVETMPGLRTVLVRFDNAATDVEAVARAVAATQLHLPEVFAADAMGDTVHVRVDYSGPDLDDVAAHTGLSSDEVIAAHLAGDYRVALIGMAPGFYFLSGGDPRLHVPRRPSPRTDVPKGALGLAGDYTGIYPRRGPGGWQLIGRVVDDLWHPTRIPAAMLPLGTVVRFAAA